MSLRNNISPILLKKLRKFYALTLDINNDGVVNWADFEAAVDNIVSKEDAEKNSRLNIVRRRLEQNFQKYFWDLCNIGDANKDGNIDLDEWLDVINDIIAKLKSEKKFPDWYEGLHKALWRSNEFLDERDVTKTEFVNIFAIWEIDQNAVEKAYDYMTDGGKKKLNYALFDQFMQEFFTNDTPNHPVNLALD